MIYDISAPSATGGRRRWEGLIGMDGLGQGQAIGAERAAADARPPDEGSAPDLDRVELGLRTYKQAVYESLREMIVWLDLPPGERLVENELAARFGVSKTPVREALALLDADGLVDMIPYRGTSVRWLTVPEMHEQNILVDALEIPAFGVVAERITAAELDAVGDMVAHLKAARAARDYRVYGAITLDMHRALMRPSGLPRLRKLIDSVVGPVGLRYDRVLVYAFDDAWDVYLELTVGRYEAIRERDPERAAEIVTSHRRRLETMAIGRLDHPEVARYFQPTPNINGPPARWGR
jgi:DNA-binding GntR family transcriptional regulator